MFLLSKSASLIHMSFLQAFQTVKCIIRHEIYNIIVPISQMSHKEAKNLTTVRKLFLILCLSVLS